MSRDRASHVRGASHAPRVRPVWAILALTLVVSTGCGPVNAGSSDAASFTAWMKDTTGVASTDIGGSNDLPWNGSVRALIVTEPDLSRADLDAVVERTITFEPRASRVEASVETTLAGVTVTFAVSPTKIDNSASADLALAVAELDDVVAVTVDQEYGNVDGEPAWGLSVVTSGSVEQTRRATLDLLVGRGEVAKSLAVDSDA